MGDHPRLRRALAVCSTVVEDWDVADPDGKSLEEVRLIRDQIAGRVEDLITERAEKIRSDRTAHESRLASILPQLVEEFEDERQPDAIRACADAVLNHYDDVPIRSHVSTLAAKRIRECLQAEACHELEPVS